MFEPLYTRSKLAKRLESLAKSAAEDLSNAVGKIKEHIAIKLETLSKPCEPIEKATEAWHRSYAIGHFTSALASCNGVEHGVVESHFLYCTVEVRQEHQDIAAAEPRDGFLWDKYVEHFILTYRNLFKKVSLQPYTAKRRPHIYRLLLESGEQHVYIKKCSKQDLLVQWSACKKLTVVKLSTRPSSLGDISSRYILVKELLCHVSSNESPV